MRPHPIRILARRLGAGERGRRERRLDVQAKMERLSDKSSTNLYIEGLPLSIDEATLSALVSPYSIRSSRFFQTKLSSPPRIIAFVRLETRSAAEEIIERLHGRMVRGWNDPGSRISVRFADTSEQRELRVTDGAINSRWGSGFKQLSIAQATLLNLRGKELHTRPPINASSTHMDDFHEDTYGHFQSNAPYPESDFEVDYSRVPARYPHSLPAQQPLNHFGQHQQLPAAPQRMNPAMASLLDSLQASGTGSAFRGHDVYAQDGIDYRTLQQQQLASLSNTHSFSNPRPFVPHGLGIGPAQTQAHAATRRQRSLSCARGRTRCRRSAGPSRSISPRRAITRWTPSARTSAWAFHEHERGGLPRRVVDPHQLPGRPQQQQFENGERIMKQLNAHALHTQQQQHTNTSSRLPRTQSQQQQHLSASLRGPSQNHDFIRTRRLRRTNRRITTSTISRETRTRTRTQKHEPPPRAG
ncbi:hypothetical protein B0H13DRAFT_1870567 [Mycena leptocephala]|nr:hypothetical protein B0H13DRAFT_1870567 [Mycena leptocephala]